MLDKKTFAHGLVNHALVAGLEKFCKQFATLVCQLETKFLQVNKNKNWLLGPQGFYSPWRLIEEMLLSLLRRNEKPEGVLYRCDLK